MIEQRIFSQLIRRLRDVLYSQGFEEAFTPLLVPEVNTEPFLHYLHLPDGYLIASPELGLKKYLFDFWDQEAAQASAQESVVQPKVFQLGPVFRGKEPTDSPLHATEFLMLEYYHPAERLEEAISFFKNTIDELFRWTKRTSPTWTVLSIPELFYQRTGLTLSFDRSDCLIQALKKFNPHSPRLSALGSSSWNDLFFEIYTSALDPWLTTQQGVVLTHWPASISSMARPSTDLPGTVERFEFVYRGIELCNGYMETFDPALIRRQMEFDRKSLEQDRALPERWLARLEENWHKHCPRLPSMAGLSTGVERLALMVLHEHDATLPLSIHGFRSSHD